MIPVPGREIAGKVKRFMALFDKDYLYIIWITAARICLKVFLQITKQSALVHFLHCTESSSTFILCQVSTKDYKFCISANKYQ